MPWTGKEGQNPRKQFFLALEPKAQVPKRRSHTETVVGWAGGGGDEIEKGQGRKGTGQRPCHASSCGPVARPFPGRELSVAWLVPGAASLNKLGLIHLDQEAIPTVRQAGQALSTTAYMATEDPSPGPRRWPQCQYLPPDPCPTATPPALAQPPPHPEGLWEAPGHPSEGLVPGGSAKGRGASPSDGVPSSPLPGPWSPSTAKLPHPLMPQAPGSRSATAHTPADRRGAWLPLQGLPPPPTPSPRAVHPPVWVWMVAARTTSCGHWN